MDIFGFLQFDPAAFRKQLRELNSSRDKLKTVTYLAGQTALVSAFCLAFITLFSMVFGPANSVVGLAVLLFVQLFRVSDLGMRPAHGMWVIAALFAVLAAGPKIVNMLEPGWAFAANAGFIFLIALIGCHNTSSYNQVVLVLSYLLLTGLDVSGRDYALRLAALGTGAAITMAVFWFRHGRSGNDKPGFSEIMRAFDMSSGRTRWQIRIALGVAGSFLISALLGWDRPVWAGITTMSVMMPASAETRKSVRARILWNIACCGFFLVLYAVVPIDSSDILDMLSGVGLGFTVSFIWESVVNAALAAFAMPAYELPVAVVARALNNLMGASFGWASGSAVDRILRRLRRR